MTRRHPRYRRRRAFTLMEMLGILILLSAFALVSARLFTSVIRTIRDTRAAETSAAQFDHMLSQLRADTWSATQITTRDTTLLLQQGPSRTITWSTAHNALSRTEVSAAPGQTNVRHWNLLTPRLSFRSAGPLLSLQVQDKTASDTFSLPSQFLLTQGGRQ